MVYFNHSNRKNHFESQKNKDRNRKPIPIFDKFYRLISSFCKNLFYKITSGSRTSIKNFYSSDKLGTSSFLPIQLKMTVPNLSQPKPSKIPSNKEGITIQSPPAANVEKEPKKVPGI